MSQQPVLVVEQDARSVVAAEQSSNLPLKTKWYMYMNVQVAPA